MENMLVSAIVTTHNRPPNMVLRAVNSVLNQTYSNIELIVVDDSSNNYPRRGEVEHAVIELSDRIRYVKHGVNRGGCAARNTGLELSKGDYIAFLDDDDEWIPEKIEEQLKGFIDDKVALVYCKCIEINEITGLIQLKSTKAYRGNVFQELLKRNFIGGSSNPLIKKSYIQEVGGFDELMQSAQDYDLWLRITQHYSVNYIDKPLLNYYIHQGDQISTDVNLKISGLERLNLKYQSHLENDNMAWYMRHRYLLPFYLKKYGKKRSISLWFQCVEKMPLQIYNNLKDIMLIVIGPEHAFLFVRKIHLLLGDRIE